MRMVQCFKLKKEAEGLSKPPMPGEQGQKIYDQISKEAWSLWMDHQTMLINENRLSMMDPNSRAFIKKEMENFLFGSGSEKPAGYVPKNQSSS